MNYVKEEIQDDQLGEEREEDVFFVTVDRGVCLICGSAIALAKRHFSKNQNQSQKTISTGHQTSSSKRTKRARELNAALGKQQSFFTTLSNCQKKL